MRFELTETGVEWKVKKGEAPHTDEYEMSGRAADFFVSYGIDEKGTLILSRYIVFPTLRTIPNDTHASFRCALGNAPSFLVDGKETAERGKAFSLDGMLKVESACGALDVRRSFFPSKKEKAGIERLEILNGGEQSVLISPAFSSPRLLCRGRGTKGCYRVEEYSTLAETTLSPGQCLTFYLFYTGRIANEDPTVPDGDGEYASRGEEIARILANGRLTCQCKLLERFYNLAKFRACESIFATDGGLFHSPGGRSYYAATWCNDEIEYAGPFFATLFDKDAREASMNAYRSYIPFMDDDYHRIPSSVIAEGRDIWEGAGDRGDAAMFLYGASLFCLYGGEKKDSDELWQAIRWCAEYCRRRTLPEGVIASDTDELEGRFPTDGRANLSTSCLTYGGLRMASVLAQRRSEDALAHDYSARADALALAIEDYFGAELHGFHTYRYSAGFDTLRGWICLPLAVGLYGRKEGTVAAMLSPYLHVENGMLSCEPGDGNRSRTVWDRAALYGYKGAVLAGCGEEIADNLINYMKTRLLCDRVPYPVEAYPEGNMRHLSGESALFCRVVTEGFFGVLPCAEGFEVCVRLPRAFGDALLENLCLGGMNVTVGVCGERVTVISDGKTIGEALRGEKIVIPAPETVF